MIGEDLDGDEDEDLGDDVGGIDQEEEIDEEALVRQDIRSLRKHRVPRQANRRQQGSVVSTKIDRTLYFVG